MRLTGSETIIAVSVAANTFARRYGGDLSYLWLVV